MMTSITESFEDIAHARCRTEIKAEIFSVRHDLGNLEKQFDEHKMVSREAAISMENSLSKKMDGLLGSMNGIRDWMLKVEGRLGHTKGQMAIVVALALMAGGALFGIASHFLKH